MLQTNIELPELTRQENKAYSLNGAGLHSYLCDLFTPMCEITLIIALIPGEFYQFHNLARSRNQRASTSTRYIPRITRRELQL